MVSVPFILSAALILGISYMCVILWRRGKTLYLAAWIYYVITIFPALGLVQVGNRAGADRFTYSTTLSFYFLLGMGALWVLEKKPGSFFRASFKPGIIACGILLLALLSFMSHRQIGVWKNGETLWSYVIHYFPHRHAFVYNNLGIALSSKGKAETAIAQYKEAIRLDPNYEKAHYNLGNTMRRQGNFEEAIVHYKEAIRLYPDYVQAHSNLGVALSLARKPEEAIVHYLAAIRLKPDFAKAYYNLGNTLVQLGNLQGAIKNYEITIKIDPDFTHAHSALKMVQSFVGKAEEAANHFDAASGQTVDTQGQN